MMSVWMVLRYLRDGHKYLGLGFVLAVLGVMLSVAALVVAMAVVSGYETTLRETVVDMHGHMMILERGGLITNRMETELKIQSLVPELAALTPFALVEGVIVHQGKMSGVLLEGIQPETATMVMNLGRVLSQGEYNLTTTPERDPPILIGKGLFKKFKLQVGESLRLVTPLTGQDLSGGFQSKVQKFQIVGVLDMGRHDYDERYLVADIGVVQNFADLGDKISGWRVRLSDYRQAKSVSERVQNEMGPPFLAKYWRDSNKNLFDAVQYEKPIIFIIVALMLVAAAFNISSTLFVNVVRRYREIGILKAMGAQRKFIQRIFAVQGLVIGLLGSLLGIGLGNLLCQVFVWAEKKWNLFPGDVYKLTFVRVEMRLTDIIFIVCVSVIICYLATLAPARKGAKLVPVEGLRYE